MEVHVWSPYKILPKDLLRTRISWVAHDLDKTINAQIDADKLKSIGDNESRILKSVLQEWKKREYDDDEIIKWARNVLEEYHLMLKDGIELNRINIPTSKFNSQQMLELIKTRRSIRRWEQKAIPVDLIKQILEAASWAPSACNRQSCRYITLQSNTQKQLLVNLREEWLKYAPVIIFIGSDKRNYLPVEYDYVPYMDAAVATQNMLLMAHALGLGATMVKCTGWDLLEGRSHNYSGKILNMYEGLNLPKHFIPVAIVALGYPLRVPKEPARLPIESTVVFEKYGVDGIDDTTCTYSDLIETGEAKSPDINSIGTKELFKIIIKRVLKKTARKIGL
jgi:nitroreductase